MTIRKKQEIIFTAPLAILAIYFGVVIIIISILIRQTEFLKMKDYQILQKGVAIVINGSDSWCSAAAIGVTGEPVEYFLTCYHGVSDDDGIESTNEIYITPGGDNADEIHAAEIIYADKDHDIAILRAKEKFTSMIPLALSADVPESGSAVFFMGFSGASQTDTLDISSAQVFYSDGELDNGGADVTFSNDTLYKDMYQITALFPKGFSGCPTFDANRCVIGISSVGINNGNAAERNVLSAKIGYVADVLDELGIRYSIYSSGRFLSLVISVIIVSVVCFTVFITLQTIFDKRNKSTPTFKVEMQSAEDVHTYPQEPINNNNELNIIAYNKCNARIFSGVIQAGKTYVLYFKGDAAVSISANRPITVKALNRSIPIKAVRYVRNSVREIEPDENKSGEIEMEIEHGYVFVESDEYYFNITTRK